MTALIVTMAAAAAFAFTFLATLRAVVAPSRLPVATSNHRSMHVGGVPTSGGVAVVASALAGSAAVSGLGPLTTPILLGAVVLLGISWLDDATELSASWRFAAQVFAASLAVSAIHATAGPVLGGVLPPGSDALVAILALVWFVNLFNFMDGIDGIAGAEGIAVLAGALAVHAASGGTGDSLLPTLAVLLMSALAGFLFWNWHPARIFLGDAGAVPIGFLVAAVLFDLAARVSLAAALILPLVFAADASLTLVRRLVAGEQPWVPHRTHLYQRAALADARHDLFVGRMSAVNMALAGLALLALAAPVAALGLAVGLVSWFFLREEDRIRRVSPTAGQAAVSAAGSAPQAPDSAPNAPRASGGAPKYAGH